MLNIADLKLLRDAYSAYSELQPAEALRMIGNPSADELAERALAGMADRDRNLRVLMLRVLQHQRGDTAMRALLAGLNDETRRVCAVAIQASGNYLDLCGDCRAAGGDRARCVAQAQIAAARVEHAGRRRGTPARRLDAGAI